MWLLWLFLGIAIAVAWLVYGGRGLCPRCGIELARDFGVPGGKVDHCRCGWRSGERP
jgi:hypothetical protein